MLGWNGWRRVSEGRKGGEVQCEGEPDRWELGAAGIQVGATGGASTAETRSSVRRQGAKGWTAWRHGDKRGNEGERWRSHRRGKQDSHFRAGAQADGGREGEDVQGLNATSSEWELGPEVLDVVLERLWTRGPPITSLQFQIQEGQWMGYPSASTRRGPSVVGMGSSWPYENPVPRYQFCAARIRILCICFWSLITHTTSHLASRPPNARARRAGAHTGCAPAALKRDERTKRRGDLPLAVVPLSSRSLRLRSIEEKKVRTTWAWARTSLEPTACCMWAWHRFLLLGLMWPGRKPAPTYTGISPLPDARAQIPSPSCV
ncbi:hypothetical protein BC826DRAFT_1176904 [Russula brevipes]|nr:hypothetical protein BC826DRAFT_1176904 [Russula brevipes]